MPSAARQAKGSWRIPNGGAHIPGGDGFNLEPRRYIPDHDGVKGRNVTSRNHAAPKGACGGADHEIDIDATRRYLSYNIASLCRSSHLTGSPGPYDDVPTGVLVISTAAEVPVNTVVEFNSGEPRVGSRILLEGLCGVCDAKFAHCSSWKAAL
jgi:hypothetical protein